MNLPAKLYPSLMYTKSQQSLRVEPSSLDTFRVTIRLDASRKIGEMRPIRRFLGADYAAETARQAVSLLVLKWRASTK